MSYTVKEKCHLAMSSLLDSCELVSGYSGGKVEKAEYNAYFTPETMWYNRVHLSAAAAGKEEETVAAVAEGVKGGNLPLLISWLDCDFDPAAIRPVLKAAGYVDPLPVQRAMFLDLEGYEPAAVTLNVEHVPAELNGDWSDMVAEAFGKPTEKPGMLLIAEDANCDFLMYRVDGKMVAGMLLICVGDNAGIHEVGTLEAFRGKGIASNLLNCALAIAKEKGCKYATLQASPMGAPLYASLGFEDVGGVHSWIMMPPEGMVL